MTVETQFAEFDSLPLDCGETIAPVTVAYETYGELNRERSNAILIQHAFSGDAHAAGISKETGKPGWWDNMIGPHKAFDTTRYFVICSNILGGCRGTTGPSSINPATGRPYGASFPVITVRDMVRLQKKLIDQLGIPRLLSVSGGSMGGMQALSWTVEYPDAVASAKAILRALDHDDVPSIRAMAARMVNDLSPSVGAGAPARTAAGEAPAATQELYAELQAIEDLLTGTESERRQGLERLHQLVRKLRTH